MNIGSLSGQKLSFEKKSTKKKIKKTRQTIPFGTIKQ